jgi:hypothetical protein
VIRVGKVNPSSSARRRGKSTIAFIDVTKRIPRHSRSLRAAILHTSKRFADKTPGPSACGRDRAQVDPLLLCRPTLLFLIRPSPLTMRSFLPPPTPCIDIR